MVASLTVHSSALPGRWSRMIGLGQAVLDVMFGADAVKDVQAEEAAAGSFAVLWQVGEGHAVVGEHRVDFVWEGGHDVSEEGRARHFTGPFGEFDVGELGDAVDGQEQDALAVGVFQFAAVRRAESNKALGAMAAPATLGAGLSVVIRTELSGNKKRSCPFYNRNKPVHNLVCGTFLMKNTLFSMAVSSYAASIRGHEQRHRRPAR